MDAPDDDGGGRSVDAAEPADDEPGSAEDEEEWRFGVDDVGPEAAEDEAEADDGESVFGPFAGEGDGTLVPGEPEPEHVLFVALGVATSLLLLADLLGFI